ncbi:14376_t:CDS:2, partial [Funneliformis mosseae]
FSKAITALGRESQTVIANRHAKLEKDQKQNTRICINVIYVKEFSHKEEILHNIIIDSIHIMNIKLDIRSAIQNSKSFRSSNNNLDINAEENKIIRTNNFSLSGDQNSSSQISHFENDKRIKDNVIKLSKNSDKSESSFRNIEDFYNGSYITILDDLSRNYKQETIM